ncbi:protein phosphatase 2c, putative [Ichthyophthirius multifiliis]|uniref:Protein phosphatase 2c, putative n=1 Tax=Ichthyophthirius multifiliis TaxID=5932 RepID=G0QR98_ICHMU|nr:protein phosphatase 2c, putative [Ichthyophthirius multifiliis]EGR32250.1 protein phosphatase 2c, putative [Ichthyophthirius multifiliis]|eukprot:XP_004035736.1 protein phosphatase 2c, putative [Ichthyophthirius multifiliis]
MDLEQEKNIQQIPYIQIIPENDINNVQIQEQKQIQVLKELDNFQKSIFKDPKPKKRDLKLDLKSALEFMTNESQSDNSQKKLKSHFNFNQEELYYEKQNNQYDNFHEFKYYCDVSMKKCSRKDQEDRFQALFPIEQQLKYDAFFAVFDGHSTSDIADILKQNLHKYIYQHPQYNTDLQQAIKESFKEIDQKIIQMQTQQSLNQGGSTALCCLVKQENLYIINCGDSTCVLVTNDNNIIFLNQLHKPSEEKEMEMLKKKGAIILGKNRINGQLGISRSIGDSEYKEFITSEPDIFTHQIQENYKYCIMATDGFWDEENNNLLNIENNNKINENFQKIEQNSPFSIKIDNSKKKEGFTFF